MSFLLVVEMYTPNAEHARRAAIPAQASIFYLGRGFSTPVPFTTLE